MPKFLSTPDGTGMATVASSLRSGLNCTGGGTVSVSASYEVKWTQRFIVIANGRGAHFANDGYFNIDCPAESTVITGLAGAGNATVTASGVPLLDWQALYYILPIGDVPQSLDANFRIVRYSSDIEVPAHWLLVAIRNNENTQFRFCNGVSLAVSDSWAITDPYPRVVSIARGGTNSTATAIAGGIGYGTGTAHAYSAAGTTGQFLKTGVAGAPTWATLAASDLSDNSGLMHLAGTETVTGAKIFSAASDGPWAMVIDRSDVANSSVRLFNDSGTLRFYNYLGTTNTMSLTQAGALSVAAGLTVNGAVGFNGAATFNSTVGVTSDLTVAGLFSGSGAGLTGTASSLTSGFANVVNSPDGDRNAWTKLPTTSSNRVRFDFVTATSAGTLGNYAGVMTYAPWAGTTESTGDASYQLAFGSTAVNGGGIPFLNIRKGIDSTWNSWYTILHTGSLAVTNNASVGTASGIVTITNSLTPAFTSLTLTTDLAIGDGGTGGHAAPVAGGVIYGVSTSAYGTTAAGVAGDILVSGGAAAPSFQTSPWTSFGSAALTAATTNPTLGSGGVALLSYVKIGKTVTCQFSVTFGSSGTDAGSGSYRLTLPFTAATAMAGSPPCGIWNANCAGGQTNGQVFVIATTYAQFYYMSAAVNGSIVAVNATQPGAWTTANNLRGSFTYEAA